MKTQTVFFKLPDQGLFIPPTIWAAMNFIEQDTILMILCDRPYEKDDYIRDYDAFLSIRAERDP